MIAYSKSFVDACKLASMQDDGVIDKTESKTLSKIEKATADYVKTLEKLIK